MTPETRRRLRFTIVVALVSLLASLTSAYGQTTIPPPPPPPAFPAPPTSEAPAENLPPTAPFEGGSPAPTAGGDQALQPVSGPAGGSGPAFGAFPPATPADAAVVGAGGNIPRASAGGNPGSAATGGASAQGGAAITPTSTAASAADRPTTTAPSLRRALGPIDDDGGGIPKWLIVVIALGAIGGFGALGVFLNRRVRDWETS